VLSGAGSAAYPLLQMQFDVFSTAALLEAAHAGRRRGSKLPALANMMSGC
jgi:hypothetical protein